MHLPRQFPSGRPFPEAFARAYLLQQRTVHHLQSPYFVTEVGLMRFLWQNDFKNRAFTEMLKSNPRPLSIRYPPSGAQLFHIEQLEAKKVKQFIQTHPTPSRLHQPDMEWGYFGVRWDVLSVPKTLPCPIVSSLLHRHRLTYGLTEQNFWMDSRVVHHFRLLQPASPMTPVQLPVAHPWYSLDDLKLNSPTSDCISHRLQELDASEFPNPDQGTMERLNPEFDDDLVHPTIAAFFSSASDPAPLWVPHGGVPSATWSYLELLRESQHFPPT